MEEVGWSGERYSNDLETVTTSGHQDDGQIHRSREQVSNVGTSLANTFYACVCIKGGGFSE